MKTIENTDQLVEIVRNMLIAQSELSSERVLNSLSLQGVELDKLLEEQIYNSIDQQDTTLLFELISLDSNSNVSMEETDSYNAKELTCSPFTICSPNTITGDLKLDTSITYYKMYQLKIILYGSSSSAVALQLAGRLRTSKVRTNLYSSGIYLEKVSEPDAINEFKNNIVWLRNDINIDLGVKYSIPQIDTDEAYDNVNKLIIRRI